MGNVVPSIEQRVQKHTCAEANNIRSAVVLQQFNSRKYYGVCLICLLKASASLLILAIAIHFVRRIFLPQPAKAFAQQTAISYSMGNCMLNDGGSKHTEKETHIAYNQSKC